MISHRIQKDSPRSKHLDDDSHYLQACLDDIEKRLEWGTPLNWTNANFENLKDRVHETSGTLISVRTLKRLFGKEKSYQGRSPQMVTKNALVNFLGFKHWEEYVSTIHADTKKEGNELAIPAKKAWSSVLLTTVLCALIVSFGIVIFNGRESNSTSVVLSAKQLNTSYPLIFGFFYSVEKSLLQKTVTLEFEDNFSESISKPSGYLNKTYMVPNLYRPKIVVDSKPIKTIPVLVPSYGWVATTQGRVIDNIETDGKLHLQEERLQALDIKFANDEFFTEYRNIKHFKIPGDRLTFSARVKHEYPNFQCGSYEIEVIGTEGKLYAIFVDPQCSQWSKVEFGSAKLDGVSSDLTAFEQDLYQWNTIEFKTQHNVATFFVNDKPIMKIKSEYPMGELVGIIFRFKGIGSVDYVEIKNNLSLACRDDF